MVEPVPPKPKRRRLRWLAAALLALLAALHTAAWWVATARIEAGLSVFIAQSAAYGWTVGTGRPVRTGWPFAATIRLPSVDASGLLYGAGLRWTADQVDVSLAATLPLRMSVAPSGLQTLRFADGNTLPLRASRMLAHIPVSGSPVDFAAASLAAGAPPNEVMVAELQGSLTPLTLAMRANAIGLPPGTTAPFDQPLDVAASLAINAPFTQATAPREAATAWRAAGGRIDLVQVDARWGRLHVDGAGTGSLDAQLQPEFHATLHAQGATELLDQMAQRGLVPPGQATAARAVLGLLTAAARGGPVTIPVVLSDRVLTVTRFPILRLPPLDWNSP